jgi:ethanolamine utilization cobalamin adenosyltransferase
MMEAKYSDDLGAELDRATNLAQDAKEMIEKCEAIFEMVRSCLMTQAIDAELEATAVLEMCARSCDHYARIEASNLLDCIENISRLAKGSEHVTE